MNEDKLKDKLKEKLKQEIEKKLLDQIKREFIGDFLRYTNVLLSKTKLNKKELWTYIKNFLIFGDYDHEIVSRSFDLSSYFESVEKLSFKLKLTLRENYSEKEIQQIIKDILTEMESWDGYRIIIGDRITQMANTKVRKALHGSDVVFTTPDLSKSHSVPGAFFVTPHKEYAIVKTTQLRDIKEKDVKVLEYKLNKNFNLFRMSNKDDHIKFKNEICERGLLDDFNKLKKHFSPSILNADNSWMFFDDEKMRKIILDLGYDGWCENETLKLRDGEIKKFRENIGLFQKAVDKLPTPTMLKQ